MKIINRTVMVLSLVSFFADIASEMLYPVIPIYLKEIGFSIFLIGVLEGLAECTAGLSKGYFGKRSDETGLRLPYIKSGYLLSAISKPMMGMIAIPVWIFVARTVDRLGKGLRTAARDALLSQNAMPETKARVFGFHRSMDTAGAVVGPLVALAFLYFLPGQYRLLFFVAFIPGLLSVALIFLLREKKMKTASQNPSGFFTFLKYWKQAPGNYRRLVTGLLLFALINSSDVFLLLKTKEITGSDAQTIMVYVFYNLVYAIAAYPMGMLADRWSFKKVFVTGLLLFATVYTLFGLSHSLFFIITGFFIYGIYAAATESIAKAWITQIADASATATAIGFYTSLQSICTLLASVIAGLIWTSSNSTVVFMVSACGAASIAVYFMLVKNISVPKSVSG